MGDSGLKVGMNRATNLWRVPMKLTIGLILAVCIGIGCRCFGIPVPGPPAILGAVMAIAMASGYTVTNYVITHRPSTARVESKTASQHPDAPK